MHDPLFPEDEQEPLDDPTLDALERSIEKEPTGFSDPLATPHEPAEDTLGRLLSDLESAIEENAPPQLPAPDEVEEAGDVTPVIEEAMEPEVTPPTEDAETPGSIFDPGPPNGMRPPIPARHPPTRSPVERTDLSGRRGGGGRSSRGYGPREPGRHSRGRSGVGRGPAMRYCPETRELIDESRCWACEKFRHWPEGTEDEPRECWYDWRDRKASEPPEDEEE